MKVNAQFKTKNWYTRWWGILIIVIFTILLIFFVAICFYFYDLVKNAKKEISSENIKLSGKIYEATSQDSYWIGSAKPKVTIVEFADFACSYSKNSFAKAREISLKYRDDVKLIFRDYPLLSETSLVLALAARCAGEQGLFWLMHDKLFQNQGISETDQIVELANQIGANLTKFKSCLSENKYLTQIEKDLTAAEKLGVTGTPTWFINGYKVEGDIPYNIFTKIVESLLK